MLRDVSSATLPLKLVYEHFAAGKYRQVWGVKKELFEIFNG